MIIIVKNSRNTQRAPVIREPAKKTTCFRGDLPSACVRSGKSNTELRNVTGQATIKGWFHHQPQDSSFQSRYRLAHFPAGAEATEA